MVYTTVDDEGGVTSYPDDMVSAFAGLLPLTNGGIGSSATPLKLYLLKERETPDTWYAKYEGMIVVAASEEDARCVPFLETNDGWSCSGLVKYDTRHLLVVKEVGIANPDQVANTVLLEASL